jgi:uncharacterized membrane protein YidH (DUF202 family)
VRTSARERTELAWERSALGPLAAAALLLFKHLGPTPARVLLIAADLLLALVIIWLGRRRDDRTRSPRTNPGGRMTVPDAGREVVGAAVAAIAIALATAGFLLFGT